ncbi:MAG: hypothetical protein ACLU38_05230 [Dysosmobacter sp.]
MFDENNPIRPQDPEIRSQDPETPAETPAVPRRVLPRRKIRNGRSRRSIVSWYTPKEPEGREVVNYYVQRTPMPQSVWKQAAKKEKHRSRLWLWISLAVVAVTVAAVVLTTSSPGAAASERPLPDGDGDNPSSIVDIFGSKATTIPASRGIRACA